MKRKKFPPRIKERLLRWYSYRCAQCGAEGLQAQLEIDHIIPLSKGGTNLTVNLQILCRPCNQAKGAGDL